MLRTRFAQALTSSTLAAVAFFSPLSGAAHAKDSADAKKITCGGALVAPPAMSWSDAQDSNCGVMGSPGHRVIYSWSTNPGANGLGACVEVWGFDPDHPKGKWFSMGCGTSARASVPWGNVAAMPKIRAQGMSGVIGVRWSH